MLRLCRLATIFCAFALLEPSGATAGGWWSFIQLDRSRAAVGQTVTLKSAALDLRSQGSEAQAYFVYLLRGFDDSVLERAMVKAVPGDWWSAGDAALLPVARVWFDRGWARASFRVPDIAPGSYALMLCDVGCRRPLGSVVPRIDFFVVTDPMTAQLAAQLDRLERRLEAHRLPRFKERVDRDLGILTIQSRATAAELNAQVARLRGDLRALERDMPEDQPWWIFAGWFAAGVLLGGLGVLLYRLRRRSDVLQSLSDEELLALLTAAPEEEGTDAAEALSSSR
jgi:hypothetical protein